MGERTFESCGDTLTVKFDDSQETKDKVFQYLLDNYFFKHESFCGESIMQSDNPQIEASWIMSELADDIIKFDVDYGD